MIKRRWILIQYLVVIYIEEINTWQVSKNVENIRDKARFFVRKNFVKMLDSEYHLGYNDMVCVNFEEFVCPKI